MKLKVFIICWSIFMICCNTDQNSLKYKSEFRKYLNKSLNIEIKDERSILIFIINVSCCSCTEYYMRSIKDIENNTFLKIIFVGEADKTFEKDINELKQKFECIDDRDGKIYLYETNFAKVLFAHYKFGECLCYYDQINLDFKDIENYINTYNQF